MLDVKIIAEIYHRALLGERDSSTRIRASLMPVQRNLISDIEGMTKTAPDLSRRVFFMTGSAAAAAGYTLAAGPVRADIITTDTVGLMAGGTGAIKVRDGEMPYYAAAPVGISKPPIIIVAPEVFGLHEYIKDVVRRLAKLGALAVAPDYYFRQGDLTKITEISQLMPLVNAKTDAELVSDLNATVEWAAAGGAGGRSEFQISRTISHLPLTFCRTST